MFGHQTFQLRLTLLTFFLAGLGYTGGQTKDAQQPADALPKGSLLRIGSLKWRHGEPITFLAMPNDGKSLVTAGQDSVLRVWDRETGNEIRRFVPPEELKGNGIVRANVYMQGLTRAAMSKDGKLLAVALSSNNVQLWEAESGKALRRFKSPTNGVAALAFTPDNKTLVIRGVTDRVAYVHDVESGKELRQLKSINPNGKGNNIFGGAGDGTGVAIAADGKTIALSELEFDGMKVTGSVTIFELESGKQLRRIESQQNGISSVALSPDGKSIVFNTYNALHVHEAETGNEIRQIKGANSTSLILFSPDGQTLAVKGRDQQVKLYDPKTGNLVRTIGDAAAARANVGIVVNSNGAPMTDLVFSADSKTLVLGGQHIPRFFEVATGKEQELVGGGHRGAVTAMIAGEKSFISRGAEGIVRVWNSEGKEIRQFAESASTSAVRFSLDGKMVALANNDGTVNLINLDDGKQIKQVKAHQGSIAAVAFSADGKRFATRGNYDGTLRVFDIAKGTQLKEITYLDVKAAAGAGNAVVIVRTMNGQRDGNPLAFSPDGKTLATFIAPQQILVQGRQQVRPDSNCLCLYDVASGKEVRRIPMTDGRVIHQLVYSLDGRLLISENVDKTVSFWEIASGQERSRLGQAVNATSQAVSTSFVAVNGVVRTGPAIAPIGNTIAVSPDGSLVAVPGADRSIKVFDAYAGKELTTLHGHNGAITALEFSVDGKKLMSGSTDTTLLVWDVARLKTDPRPQIAKLEAKELDSLWNDLIGSDAVKAGDSIKKLIAAGNASVAQLNAHVEPAAPVDAAKVDQWIRDLDSPNFKKRAQASKELDKLGELAIPALQKALAERPSLEIRRRLEPILDELTGTILTPEQIRIVRAIEVLDKIGTAEARKVLERLASGAAGSLTTRQAQTALQGLGK